MDSKFKILVIDDDHEMREALKTFLRRNDFEVDSAKNAAEAFVKLRTERFDVVLTDVVMTPINGLLLIGTLMERQITFDFIVITGNDSLENRDQATHLGAKGYLVKPFNPDELLDLIHQIVDPKNCSADAKHCPPARLA